MRIKINGDYIDCGCIKSIFESEIYIGVSKVRIISNRPMSRLHCALNTESKDKFSMSVDLKPLSCLFESCMVISESSNILDEFEQDKPAHFETIIHCEGRANE